MNEPLKRFVKDEAMSGAVYAELRQSFLKRRKIDDVQMLAAERLAMFLLEDAWRELQKYGHSEEEPVSSGNPGL